MSETRLPEVYKAVVCEGPHAGWKIVDMPMREPLPSEVLIKVYASGLCHGDHLIQSGIWPCRSFPRVPGHEIIGRVVSRGQQATYAAKVGALVGIGWKGGYCQECAACRSGDFPGCATQQITGGTYDGGHAEYFFAPVTAVVSMDEELLEGRSYAELAPLMCAGVTVYGALKASTFKPGDICVVQGVGGLGHLAIQYASKLGLKVYAVSSGPSKADIAKSLGAFAYIDSSTTSVVDTLQAIGGANLIISTVSSISPVSAIIPAIARHGTVIILSGADGRLEIDNLPLIPRRATLKWWECGAAPDTEECVRFSALADIKSFIHTWKLEDFTKAYEDMLHGAPQFRNVIVF